MKKEEKIVKKSINQIGLLIQIILLVILVYFLTLFIFIPEFQLVIDYILAFLLLIMAYNNYKVYKRKNMTIVYSIIGTLLLVASIVGSING